MEENKYNRGRDMPRSCTYASGEPPKYSVSSFMGYLKGKSSTILYEKYSELKFKYRNREFWCKGYYVDTVGKNKAKIAEYIRKQLEEDKIGEQLTMLGKDDDPFKGGK